jgi:hypothetical protein
MMVSGWTELSVTSPYTATNFTMYPAAGTNKSEGRLMSQAGGVCKIMCTQICVFLQSGGANIHIPVWLLQSHDQSRRTVQSVRPALNGHEK